MIVTGLEPGAMAVNSLRAVDVDSAMEFLVCTVTTQDDRASTFGFPGRSAHGAALTAHATIAPVIVGQNALDRERIWHDMRRADRAVRLRSGRRAAGPRRHRHHARQSGRGNRPGLGPDRRGRVR